MSNSAKTPIPQIWIASDHAGYGLKCEIIEWFKPRSEAYHIQDLGPYNQERVDYPDYADKLALALKQAGPTSRGVLICGSGIGMSIAVNRYPHIRAALCYDGLAAGLARAHNDANVLVLGARLMGIEPVYACLTAFFSQEFEGGRHQARVDKLSRIPLTI